MKLLLHPETKRQLKAVQLSAGSYLFIGPDGVGKFTAASMLAKQHCSNPGDIFIIAPAKTSIGIDEVHNLTEKLRLKPAKEGALRYVIVCKAQSMTREAQNAFLKLLEEPPQGTTIVLCASELAPIAPTILSRCKKITFPFMGHDAIAQYLQSELNQNSTQAERAAELAGGSIGKAIQLGREPEALAALQAKREVIDQFTKGSLYERLNLIPSMLKDYDAPSLILLIAEGLRRRLRSKPESALSLAKLLNEAESLLTYLKSNGNGRFALERLALVLP